jgi:hypothetical protein
LFLLSLPVAVQCILAYGVQLNGPRVAAHSLLGCFFYGALAAKMLIVRSRRLPGSALPVVGGFARDPGRRHLVFRGALVLRRLPPALTRLGEAAG